MEDHWKQRIYDCCQITSLMEAANDMLLRTGLNWYKWNRGFHYLIATHICITDPLQQVKYILSGIYWLS
jgi:hypothetical protein